MMKKISAIVLAIVLCLSIVVLPASASGFDSSFSFGAGKSVAFMVELDKEKYAAGDDVTVNVYMNVADPSAELKSAYLTFGIDENVFDTTNTPYESATACDEWEAYWKSPNSSALWAYVSNATILGKLEANKTADEAFMNKYIRVSVAQDTDKVTDTKHGVVASSIDPTVPFLTFTLKLKSDLPDGTDVKVAMPSASFSQTPVQTSVTYFTAPGSTTGGKAYAATTYMPGDIAAATIGGASPVEFQKAQIRFKGITATSGAATYEGTFDVRTVAQITDANFATYFTDEATAKEKISDIGFVYAAKSNVATFDADTAKTVAEGGSAANYVKVPVTYMQHTGGNYIFTCLISNIADADKTDGVNCLGYVCFDGTYYYFDAAASVDFNTLYTEHMPA